LAGFTITDSWIRPVRHWLGTPVLGLSLRRASIASPSEVINELASKGVRHAATLAAEALLDGEAEALTRKAIEVALGGDAGACASASIASSLSAASA
jgi:hypothetical protein